MDIKKFVLGQLENNVYLITDENTKKAVLIDAAQYSDEILKYVSDNGIKVEYILLTHGHFDHIAGLNELKAALKAKAVINENDLTISNNLNEFTRLFGVPDAEVPQYEMFVNDNDVINVGNMVIKVIFTPGHTQGGVCYMIDDKLFSGDTLFKDTVGRTDLFGGSLEKLSASVKDKLFKLDDNITVYPGHGPITTIGYEKKNNEILRY